MRLARLVAHFQHRELDCRVHVDVNRELRSNATLHVLKDAVAEPMSALVVTDAGARQWRGRPEMAAVFVAQIKDFPARIAHRVVVPGCEAELMGVLAPGVGKAILRDDGSKVRIRQHVHPRCRCCLPGRGRDDVFASIAGKSSQSIEED